MATLRYTRPDGSRVAISARAGAIAVLENDRTSFTFDDAGRLLGAFDSGFTYRRSLANQVLEKRAGARAGVGHRQRRWLAPAEAEALIGQAYAFARRIGREVAGRQRGEDPGDDAQIIGDALARVARYTVARLDAEAETCRRIYMRVPILPPDQYLAVVVQVTEGCSYNACAFCGFYRDRSFRARNAQELRQHIREVKNFLGRGLSLRRSVFLGDANALMMPQARLLPLVDVVAGEFSLPLYSFIDAFTSARKTAREFAELKQRGLARVYVGLETGDADLLRFLGKPNTPEHVAWLAHQVKAGGLSIGVVVLACAGGRRYADAHLRHTVDLVRRLPLGAGDIVYLSELVDYPGSTYAALAAEAGIQPLSPDAIEAQMGEMKRGFGFGTGGPRVSYYDVREFVY